jgi:hypothetical protein
MNRKHALQIGAAILAVAANLAMLRSARADCSCPSGSQWLAVGQSTKIDKCGLEILLRGIQSNPLHGDRYLVYVKSKLITPPASGKPEEVSIPQNHAMSLPAGTCGSLQIGAHRAPQKDFIEVNWSYF